MPLLFKTVNMKNKDIDALDWFTWILMIALIILFSVLTSCSRSYFGYGKAKVTVKGREIHIQEVEKLKPLPDTTMEVIMIRRVK